MADADLDQHEPDLDHDDDETPLVSGKKVVLGKYAGLLPPGTVVTVAAPKGGVGKSLLSRELAWLLGGVLLDLEWDDGSSSMSWGYDFNRHRTNPLLDAVIHERTPRVIRGTHNLKADLIPGHPTFERLQPSQDDTKLMIARWAKVLGRVLIVDTHPGGSPSSLGAMAAANVVVSPVSLKVPELNALEGWLRTEIRKYNLLVVPNMFPRSLSDSLLDRLDRMTDAAEVPVSPYVSFYDWIGKRQLRRAITAPDPIPAMHAAFVDQVHKVAEAVISLGS